MKFGICCPGEKASEALAAGFDYAEVGAHDLAEKFPALLGLSIEATNLFFPGSTRLFEPVSGDYLAHSRTAIEAASRLQIQVMVIGSGNQRRAPHGMSDQLSLKKFAEIASVIQSLAEPYGIKIAPESLNRSETNVANDLHSMAYALREVGVGFTADSYHILREAFSDSREIDWVHEIPFLPEHVHFADFPRHLPTREDPMIVGFIRRLKDLGYDRRVSFEGTLAEHSLAEAADRLNQLWTL